MIAYLVALPVIAAIAVWRWLTRGITRAIEGAFRA